MTARRAEEPEQSGWIRINWVAEKVASGELQAASTELTKHCDAIFVGQDRTEDHARMLVQCLSGQGSDGCADGGRQDLLAYLQRLLSLREMWARERS